MMTRFSAFHTRRLLLAGIMAGAGLLGATLQATGVSAHAAPCRSDPILALSNGKTLQLTATINDAQKDVSQVLYQVNLPAGVTATHITYTSGWRTSVEKVQFQYKEPANTYVTTTSVTAGSSGDTFTAADALLLGSTTLASSASPGNTKASLGVVAADQAVTTLVG